MSLIVRQLKEYSTNRSAAFAGTRTFLLCLPVNPHLSYYEIASGADLDNYYFFVTMNRDGPLFSTAADIKRQIKRSSIATFAKNHQDTCLRWNEGSTIEMDWSNPPKERMMAVVVQVRNGQPDFTAPALFMYVPEAVKKPRMKTRIKPLPKGRGPIPYRL